MDKPPNEHAAQGSEADVQEAVSRMRHLTNYLFAAFQNTLRRSTGQTEQDQNNAPIDLMPCQD